MGHTGRAAEKRREGCWEEGVWQEWGKNERIMERERTDIHQKRVKLSQ